jgi:hypothetical protein
MASAGVDSVHLHAATPDGLGEVARCLELVVAARIDGDLDPPGAVGVCKHEGECEHRIDW